MPRSMSQTPSGRARQGRRASSGWKLRLKVRSGVRWELLTGVAVLVGALTFGQDANATFCGVEGRSPTELQSNVVRNPSFRPSTATPLYATYINTKTLSTLTFTTAANNAHPT